MSDANTNKKYAYFIAKDDDDMIVGRDQDEAFDEFMARYKKVPMVILGQHWANVGDPIPDGVVLWDAYDEFGGVE